MSHVMSRLKNAKLLGGALALAMIAATLLAATGVDAANAHRGWRMGRGADRGDCLRVLARGNQVSQALDELVQDGTLTSDQAAAVREKVAADATKSERACAGLALFHSAGIGDAVRDLLQVDRQTLRSDLRAGKSLGDIAQEKNVSRDQLIATITGAIKTKLDGWVADGKLTAERETTMLTDLAPRIETLVDWHAGDQHNGAGLSATPVPGQ